MCIIVAKPAGVDVPLTETFDNCAISNKDGIGFAYNLPGERPKIVKGFAHVKKLEHMLVAHRITKEHNLLVHFRLATHGLADQGNCHPFPLTDDYSHMRKINNECDCAIAHNGVFSAMPAHEVFSDTMKFIGGVLAVPGIVDNLESPPIKELVRGYCGFGSKLAFLRPSGLSLIGNFELDEGVSYSNMQYKKYTYKSGWDTNAVGQRWCHRHKAYDDCTWCPDHKVYDDCDFQAKQDNIISTWRTRHDTGQISNPPVKLGSPSCQWCEKAEKVSYNDLEGGWLCDECTTILTDYGAI